MEKIFKKGSALRILFAAAVLMLVCCVTSCKRDTGELDFIAPRQQGVPGDSSVTIGLHTYYYGRDWNQIHITGHDDQYGRDTTVLIPCGGIDFWITPHDTSDGNPAVVHTNLQLEVETVSEFDSLGYPFVKHIQPFTDEYNQYSKSGGISWNDVRYVVMWGDTIDLTSLFANAQLSWSNLVVGNTTTDGTWDYKRFTSEYKVTCVMGERNYFGDKTLRWEAGHDTLVRWVLVNSGWYPTEFNAWNLPKKGVSWGDLAPVYSESGQGSPTHHETVTNCPITAPADSSLIAQDFNVQWKAATEGNDVNLGNSTEGLFTKTTWKKNYFVGANTPAFTRVFDLRWQTVQITINGQTFDLPAPTWSNFGESHTLDPLATQGGYEQKLATNTMEVSLSGSGIQTYTGDVPARTTIKVQSSDPTPPDTTPTPPDTTPTPPPTPTIVDSILIDQPLIYVDASHNISKTIKRYTWSDGHTTDHDITATLENGIECLSSGYFYGPLSIEGIDWGTPVYTGSHTSGDIRYDHYEVTVMVSYGLGIHKDFKATTWRPTYLPMNHPMPYADYTFAVSSLDFVSNLGTTTTQNTTYMRKLYSQGFTATLNNHTNPYSCDLEVWEADYIPRESDVCFGNVNMIHYSRGQSDYGAQYQDVIVVVFDNGWDVYVGGQHHYYAKENSGACAGYPTMPDVNYVTALWVNGIPYPAVLQEGAKGANFNPQGTTEKQKIESAMAQVAQNAPKSSWNSWVTITSVNGVVYTHSATKANAIICNIGGNGLYKPYPDAQSFSMSGPVGVLNYCQNNLFNTPNSTFMTW